MADKTISEKIADFCLDLDLSKIPSEVAEHGKLMLEDTFGVAMSNQELPHARAVRAAVTEMGSAPKCSLWGTDQKASPADAALYNGALIHGSDYDDTHVASIIHPSASVVSTALAAGELTGASGREMFEAIVVGWEVIIRLGLASKGRFHDVGYHGTGIAAPFAAACTAAKIMKDSRETLVNALGICGSQSAALQEFLRDGTWPKKIHPGWGAHSAFYSLSMARAGFLGAKKVFEGDFGMWKTHCGGVDGLEEQMSDLGSVWHTTEMTAKLYPVCHMTHSFIDCMIHLMSEHGFGVDDIDRAECRIASRYYPIVCTPREAKVRPTTDYIMRFSLPYVVAMAAVKGRVSPWEIDLKYAKDPKICALMDRIECVDDNTKDNPGCFPGYLTVWLKDGRELVREQRYEMGTKQNPLDKSAVQRKLRDNLEPFYSPDRIDRIVSAVDRFEDLKGASELIDTLKR